MGVSLVVPVRNEESRLKAFVDAVGPLVGQSLGAGLVLRQVVVIDDGSTDSTPAALQVLASRPGWTILAASSNSRGKGDAVARGAQSASAHLVLVSDVDLAAPLSEATKLAEALNDGAIIAVGSRDLAGSNVAAPRSRKAVGRAFNSFVRATTALAMRDTQCGFKLMPTDVARTLLAALLVPGLAYDVELLMRARASGYRVAEVPINYRHGEQSQVRPIVHGAVMGRDVLRLVYHLRLVPALKRSN